MVLLQKKGVDASKKRSVKKRKVGPTPKPSGWKDDKAITAAGYVKVKGIMAAKGKARAAQREAKRKKEM